MKTIEWNPSVKPLRIDNKGKLNTAYGKIAVVQSVPRGENQWYVINNFSVVAEKEKVFIIKIDAEKLASSYTVWDVTGTKVTKTEKYRDGSYKGSDDKEFPETFEDMPQDVLKELISNVESKLVRERAKELDKVHGSETKTLDGYKLTRWSRMYVLTPIYKIVRTSVSVDPFMSNEIRDIEEFRGRRLVLVKDEYTSKGVNEDIKLSLNDFKTVRFEQETTIAVKNRTYLCDNSDGDGFTRYREWEETNTNIIDTITRVSVYEIKKVEIPEEYNIIEGVTDLRDEIRIEVGFNAYTSSEEFEESRKIEPSAEVVVEEVNIKEDYTIVKKVFKLGKNPHRKLNYEQAEEWMWDYCMHVDELEFNHKLYDIGIANVPDGWSVAIVYGNEPGEYLSGKFMDIPLYVEVFGRLFNKGIIKYNK